jgi:hypothetical protein
MFQRAGMRGLFRFLLLFFVAKTVLSTRGLRRDSRRISNDSFEEIRRPNVTRFKVSKLTSRLFSQINK